MLADSKYLVPTHKSRPRLSAQPVAQSLLICLLRLVRAISSSEKASTAMTISFPLRGFIVVSCRHSFLKKSSLISNKISALGRNNTLVDNPTAPKTSQQVYHIFCILMLILNLLFLSKLQAIPHSVGEPVAFQGAVDF